MGLSLVLITDIAIYIIAAWLGYRALQQRSVNFDTKKPITILIFLLFLVLLIPGTLVLPLCAVYMLFVLDISADFGPGATILVMPAYLNVLLFLVTGSIGIYGLSRS